jgi:hypothetical protein
MQTFQRIPIVSSAMPDIPNTTNTRSISSSVIRSEHEIIRERAKRHGFKEVIVPGDSHCMFHSILKSLYPEEYKPNLETVRFLRENVAMHLQKNQEKYEPFIVDTSFDDYVNGVKGNAWGDYIILNSLANLMNLRIVVILSNPNQELTIVEPTDKEPKRTAWICNYEDVHFNALVPDTDSILDRNQ